MSSSPSKLKEDRRNEKVLMSFIFPNGSCYLRVRDLKSASKCDRSRVRGSGIGDACSPVVAGASCIASEPTCTRVRGSKEVPESNRIVIIYIARRFRSLDAYVA